MFRIAKTKAGFSLVELMVAMAVSGIVLASIYQVYSTQLKTYTTQQQIVEMQQSMRAIIYMMEREIRMAGYAPAGGLGGAGNPIFSIARADDLQYNIDINGDRDSDDSGEIVRYQMSNGQLFRGGVLVADNIDTLEIAYLDAAGDALAFDSDGNLQAPQNIRSIVITLSGTPRSPGAVRKQMSLSSEIRIRNMYGPMI